VSTATASKDTARTGTARTGRRSPVVRTVPAGAATATAAALRLVPQRRSSAPRAPFVTMVVLLLAGGLLGLLALNTVLAQDAFTLHALVKEQKALVDREQTLEREVETLRTPRNLAQRARELGMVQGQTPAFLRLPDGAVLGAEVPTASLDGTPVELPGTGDLAGDETATDETATDESADAPEAPAP
jgi:cell division protein FtsB